MTFTVKHAITVITELDKLRAELSEQHRTKFFDANRAPIQDLANERIDLERRLSKLNVAVNALLDAQVTR